MTEFAELKINGKIYKFPIINGTENEKGIDITTLRQQTGYITFDPGFANTGSCASSITFVDGEKGILRYRGIPIEELAERSSFREVAYLLINGKLPTERELQSFSVLLNDHSLVHEDMKSFFQHFPRDSHPMGILSSMITALKSFYPYIDTEEEVNITVTRLLSKVRTLAAMSYKISRGHTVIYPRPDLPYCANFLNMMFDSPVRQYEIDDDIVEALSTFLVLHADHEQNCSTSAVRVVGSGRVNLYAAISAGVAALWGPLHGGANQAVIELLNRIAYGEETVKHIVERSKDKANPFRLPGFGHRVYKTYDPRAKIMKKICDRVLKKVENDALYDIARELEEIALNDDYFVSHNLYPNVDFYSGIVLRAIGIPTNMFTVMFAIGRLPGWIAQWKESIMEDPFFRISRPRQIYIGSTKTSYIPLEERYQSNKNGRN